MLCKLRGLIPTKILVSIGATDKNQIIPLFKKIKDKERIFSL